MDVLPPPCTWAATRPHRWLAGLLLLLATALPAQGETMRCGSRLVSLGDRAFEVLRKCGEPAWREHVGYRINDYRGQERIIDEWVYGPRNGMLTILTFEGNRLVRIETRRDN